MRNLRAGSVWASRPPRSLQRALSWEPLPASRGRPAQCRYGRLHAQVARGGGWGQAQIKRNLRAAQPTDMDLFRILMCIETTRV